MKVLSKTAILLLAFLAILAISYWLARTYLPIYSCPDQATAMATIFLGAATIFLAFVAALQDFIRGWLLKPELSVCIEMDAPDCTKISSLLPSITKDKTSKSKDVYYFRFRVINSGNTDANNVEVYASELKKYKDNGWEKKKTFLPMKLAWSHVRLRSLPILSPHTERHCELGSIEQVDEGEYTLIDLDDNDDEARLMRKMAKMSADEPITRENTLFELDVESPPRSYTHTFQKGRYHLLLVVSASNAKPVYVTLEINHLGPWFDKESEMFQNGLRIQIIQQSKDRP